MRTYRVSAIAALTAALLWSTHGPAEASELVYRPINPAFGGNPNNASWLYESAGIQSRYDNPTGSGASTSSLTPAEEFAATLQRRLLFAVSDRIVNELFQGSEESGTFRVEDTTIQYVRVGNTVRLVISDGTSQTEVVVPTGY